MKIDNEFVLQYTPLIHTLIRKYVPVSEVQDITQDVFVKILQANTYDPSKGMIGTWIGTIVRHVIYDRKEQQCVQYKDTEQKISFRCSIEQDLDDVLKALEPVRAKVFKLKYYHGYSHKEISEKMNITVTQSQTLAHRAAEAIKQ